MLYQLSSDYPAVKMNGPNSFDHVTPPWVGDEALYAAIRNMDFCNGTLRNLLNEANYTDGYWSSGWWREVDIADVKFSGQSEFLPLKIAFAGCSLADLPEASAAQQLSADLGWNISNPRVAINFAMYQGIWSLPLGAAWQPESGILRRGLSPAASYRGTYAQANAGQSFDLLYHYGPAKMINGFVASSGKAKVGISAIAVARPEGQLPDGQHPAACPIVLPVFDRVSKVPSLMYAHPDSLRSLTFERFLLWLNLHGDRIVDILNLPAELDMPPRFAPYLSALQKLVNDERIHEYHYPLKDEDGNPIVNQLGVQQYGTEMVSFREYGRRWLADYGCPEVIYSDVGGGGHGGGGGGSGGASVPGVPML